MLRIYFLQQWYALGDQATEEAHYDMESMRNFSGLKLIEDAIPDETTILKFRRLIEKHDLSNALFDEINAYLVSQGIVVSKGSMIDATIVHVSSLTKNKSGGVRELGITWKVNDKRLPSHAKIKPPSVAY